MPQIDQYLHHLVEQGGSDLHLSEGSVPKMRVHGSIGKIAEDVLSA